MDITSKLIYEAYRGGYEPANLDVVEFRRDITQHFVNDFFKFKDQKTKKHYNVFQIFEKDNRDRPVFLHSTSIFDCQMPHETAMMYLNMDRQFMKSLPEYNLRLNSLPNKNKKLTAYEENVLLKIIDQVMDYDMKKRTVEAMGMKPETKEHFGDILSAVSESKQTNEPEIIDFNRIYSNNPGYRYNKIIDEITVRYNTSKGVRFYEILQHFSYSVDEKTPMFLGLELKKKVLDKKTKRWDTDLIPLRKHNQGGKPLTYIGGYELYDGLTNNTLEVDKDTFEVLKIALMSQKERLKILSTKNMKPKTKEHFGDIIGSL